ncbi:demethylmenaquinone methyltransferase-like [Oculina patagonica]
MMDRHLEKSYVEDHYRSVADKYDYFHQEIYEGFIPFLKKTLNLNPQDVLADIGSGTGLFAEILFTSFGLDNPVWCIEPSAEMQDVARKRKGIYPVQKTAEEFFSDPKLIQCFDKVITVFSAHHFDDADAVYKGIVRSLRPGGSFVQFDTISPGYPKFKMAANSWSVLYSKRLSTTDKLLKGMNLQGKISQEEYTNPWSVTKSKLYEMFRCRYVSMFYHLSDAQIEEGIKELENGTLKDVKVDDLINCNYVVRITRFNLE